MQIYDGFQYTLLCLIVGGGWVGGGGSNKIELVGFLKNNRPKTKNCMREGHKKVQHQENDPPPPYN